jgi:hypothetical protein
VHDTAYDFRTGTFRSRDGKPITNGDLDEWASAARGSGTPSLGRTALKRGILLITLARSQGSEKSRLLEHVLRQPGELVGDSFDNTFYRKAQQVSDKERRRLTSDALTQAMGGGSISLLGLIPDRGLLCELGKSIEGAKRYLQFKEEADALRDVWHSETDQLAQIWLKLMHKTGLASPS